MPDNDKTPFPERAAAEIDALHRLLEAWFRAEGDGDIATILAHFDPSFRMVGAAGKAITYEQFSSNLPNLRGTRPSLVMVIDDVVVHHLEGASALVTYRETQHQDDGTTVRWAAALLVEQEGSPIPAWKHLQETFTG